MFRVSKILQIISIITSRKKGSVQNIHISKNVYFRYPYKTTTYNEEEENLKHKYPKLKNVVEDKSIETFSIDNGKINEINRQLRERNLRYKILRDEEHDYWYVFHELLGVITITNF